MVIYLDAAALVKLVRKEPESGELRSWLTARHDVRRVTSALVEVEVPRAVRRHAPTSLGMVAPVIERVDRFEVTAEVRAAAANLQDPLLRSLDAIHLATALQLGPDDLSFVSYDRRLLMAAAANGLTVASPGLLGERRSGA